MEYHGIFDSHAHYDAERFDPDRDEVLGALPSQGVAYVMNASGDLESSRRSIALTEQYDYMYCAVGYHPHEAGKAPADFIDRLRPLAKEPKVRAIGEAGLDYHYDFAPREVQKAVFEAQLVLAAELDLPIIVHDREAHADVFQLLKKHRPKGVVHCYSGSAEMARELLKLGLYIGFTGVVTFKNANKVLRALRAVPPERLLIETDCPFLAPEPFRGKRCHSGMLPHTAAAIGRELGMTPREVIDISCENARALYRI